MCFPEGQCGICGSGCSYLAITDEVGWPVEAWTALWHNKARNWNTSSSTNVWFSDETSGKGVFHRPHEARPVTDGANFKGLFSPRCSLYVLSRHLKGHSEFEHSTKVKHHMTIVMRVIFSPTSSSFRRLLVFRGHRWRESYPTSRQSLRSWKGVCVKPLKKPTGNFTIQMCVFGLLLRSRAGIIKLQCSVCHPRFRQSSVWAKKGECRSEKAAVRAEKADRWTEETAFAEEGTSSNTVRCSKSAHVLSNFAHALCATGFSRPLSERRVRRFVC